MKIVSIQRLTYDPKEIIDLSLDGGAVKQGRVGLALNEGDIKGIALIKPLDISFDVISIGELDNTTLTHTFVRGAKEIYELGSERANQVSPQEIISPLIAQIKKIEDAQIIVCSSIEQDTGDDLLPNLIAAQLNWDIFHKVLSIQKEGERFTIEQEIDGGVQTFTLAAPFVLCPNEACELGDDPSDDYDLMEEYENRTAQKVSIEKKSVDSKSLAEQPSITAQAVIPLDEKNIVELFETIQKHTK